VAFTCASGKSNKIQPDVGQDAKSRAEGRGWRAKLLAKDGERHSRDNEGKFLAGALVILLEGLIHS
jgi:hypothetical protein